MMTIDQLVGTISPMVRPVVEPVVRAAYALGMVEANEEHRQAFKRVSNLAEAEMAKVKVPA